MSTGTSAARPSTRRFGVRPALGLALGFGLLGVAYTWPLVLHLGDGLPFAAVPPVGRETPVLVQGDYLQFYYYLWLVRDRLAAAASFLVDPYQFAVDGPRPNLPNTFLPAALVYLPLALANPRLGYNLLVLLSFPLSGLAAALLAHRYGSPRDAAIVAGTAFACAPYRIGALLGGHPAGLAYPLVPLALWGLEGALAGSLVGGVWTALALVAVAIMEPHFFYFAALGLPLYMLARGGLAGWDRRALRVGGGAMALAVALGVAAAAGTLAALARRGWRAPVAARVAVGAIVALAVVAAWQALAGWLVASGACSDPRLAARRSLLVGLPCLALATVGTGAGERIALLAALVSLLVHAVWLWRSPGARRLAAAPLALASLGAGAGAAFLLLLRQLLLRRSVASAGRTLHEVLLFSPLPTDLLVRVNPAAGRAIYPGVVALVLALVALITLARRPPTPDRRVLLAYGPVLGFALVLSLGPRLTALPLFETAFLLVPSWNFIRQPAKFQVVTGLALAVLAAMGAQALLVRLGSRAARRAVIAVLALAVAADFHPWRPTGVSLVPPAGPEHARIRATGPRALYLPLWPGDSSYSGIYLYATTLTRVPMLNGYSAWLDRSYLTDVYRPLEAVNLGVVDEGEHDTLARYGVRQVVLDRDAFPVKVSPFGPAFTRAGLRASPYLTLLRDPGDDSPLWIFRVRDAPRPGPRPPAPSSPVGIYWEAESLVRETGEVVEDPGASNGRVVQGRQGRDRPGFLQYGPYRLLPPAAFRARYRLRGDGAGVTLQVTTGGGRQVLGAAEAQLDARAGRQELEVAFTLDRVAPVEYRVRWDGRGLAELDAVHVVFAAEADPAPAFDVAALPHELAERADPDARSGFAAYADPVRAPRDIGWSGPTRRYPAGRYRLWLRLKTDRSAGRLAWCGAQLASRGPVVAGRELTGAEVPTPGRYVELGVPFSLQAPAVLDFPCLYRGETGIWFDRLHVEGPLVP